MEIIAETIKKNRGAYALKLELSEGGSGQRIGEWSKVKPDCNLCLKYIREKY